MVESKIEFYEILKNCFEEEKEIIAMTIDHRLNVSSFVSHVLSGINKKAVDGKRLIGFISTDTEDCMVFEPTKQRYLYDFEIDRLVSNDNYHCTLRFNNIDPMSNVYAIAYPISAKQAEYFKETGKMPLIRGLEQSDYTDWAKSK